MIAGEPQLVWETATAYDMFISLEVLYDPGRYGLRAAWAAGVRSRLPEKARETLRTATSAFLPFAWVHELAAPKDGAAVLTALTQLAPAERVRALAGIDSPSFSAQLRPVFERVTGAGRWSDEDLKELQRVNRATHGKRAKKEMARLLAIWSEAPSFAVHYLSALEAYYAAFFAEEETRIRPYLEAAVERGRRIAADPSLTLPDLLEVLSHGLQFTALPPLDVVALAPSFWSTPLIVDHRLDDDRLLFIFGARPEGVSLVPGETVPEDLQRALKALADPTRLRILRYLAHASLTPTQLAERLRLRPPTVVHHLHVLRMARLVQLVLGEAGGRRYALRPGAIEATTGALRDFVTDGEQNP